MMSGRDIATNLRPVLKTEKKGPSLWRRRYARRLSVLANAWIYGSGTAD